MSKPYTTTVSNFSGGSSDDPRKPSQSEFIISKHFDIFSQPNRLIPYRSLEIDTNDGSTSTGMKQYYVKDFIYASTSAKLYGLGKNGTGLTKVVYKADAVSGNWTLPASSEGNGAVKNGCFVEFKDYMWGFQGTNQLFKWGLLSGTPTITNSVSTTATTITSVAQGLIAADANLYLPYNNTLVRVAPGLTVTDAVISVPTNFKITSIANFGNYLAIGCAPISSYNGVSKVFIWNLSSDLFAETLNFGEGALRVLETIEGMLVGITDRYLNNVAGAGRGSMIVQTYAGGSPQIVKEIFTQSLNGITMPISKATKNNRLFFASKIMTNSAGTEYHEGIWSFGRKNAGYPYTLTLDVIDENISNNGIEAFNIAGNYFFVSYGSDGSIDKTDDALTYTFNSIMETQIYNAGDSSILKRLEQFTIMTAPIVTGSVTVKMKANEDSAWTTIGSFSTVGGVARVFKNIESTQADFATHKEVRFRLESTGGAEITAYSFAVLPLIGYEG